MGFLRRVGLVVMMASIVVAQKPVAETGRSFEVATIKPSAPGQDGRGMGWDGRRYNSNNMTMSQIMQFAYNVQAKQIIGEPSWFDTERFDIQGQTEANEATPAEWRLMMRHLLEERLKMHYHHEEKVMPAYVLSVAKGGPKFKAPEPDTSNTFKDVVRIQRGQHMWLRVIGAHGTMAQLAAELQRVEMDRPVVDQTGLTGKYDFTMTATSIKPFFAGDAPPEGEDAPAELFTALREQLGLKLEPTKTAVDCLVLDGVEKPVLD
jgi:uncharacterized protein (TIGR03435 family)